MIVGWDKRVSTMFFVSTFCKLLLFVNSIFNNFIDAVEYNIAQ